MTKRRRIISVLLVLFFSYIVSYVLVSRTAMREVRFRYRELDRFYYYPGDPKVVWTSPAWAKFHYSLALLYYPIWSIDYYLLDGMKWGMQIPSVTVN